MDINKKLEDGKLTVEVAGRLDTVTAPELYEALEQSLEGVSALEFDLSALEYISSAGLRTLLFAQKTLNEAEGTMVIRNANDLVKEIFDMTGFADIMTIE